MNLGDLIYGMITLVLMLLIVLSPILRKIYKSARKRSPMAKKPVRESMFESPDPPFGNEMFRENPEPAYDFSRSAPETIRSPEPGGGRTESPVSRINSLPSLKRALIWKEILDRPAGLRDSDPFA